MIIKALEKSDGNVIKIGTKSSPEEIWKFFPGMSKGQFKAGVSDIIDLVCSIDNLEIVSG